MNRHKLETLALNLLYNVLTMFSEMPESSDKFVLSEIIRANYSYWSRSNGLGYWLVLAYNATSKLFEINLLSQDVDRFMEFYKINTKDKIENLFNIENFVKAVDKIGRPLVEVSPYMEASNNWARWIRTFVDKMLLDPLAFSVELEEFSKNIKEVRDRNRLSSYTEYYVGENIDEIKTYAKTILNGYTAIWNLKKELSI